MGFYLTSGGWGDEEGYRVHDIFEDPGHLSFRKAYSIVTPLGIFICFCKLM